MTKVYQGHTTTKANADLDAIVAASTVNTSGLAAEAASRVVGDITVVASISARDATFPTPATDQRVFNKATGNVERWSGSSWVTDVTGSGGILREFNVCALGAVPNAGTRWNTGADAVAAGATDSTAAFNTALANALVAGGSVVVPQGQYYLNGQWLGTYTGHLVNVSVEGYGAELFSGASVTESALKIVGGPIPHGICIRGLKFNHRNNTTAAAAIELSGHSHGVIEDVTLEMHNVKAGYAGVKLTHIDPADDNTACFWTTIRKFRIRERSGGDGTVAPHGILLSGVQNATAIEQCAFTSCTNAISLASNVTSTGLANGVVIQSNFFEGVTVAVNVVADPGGYWPLGLRVFANRIESTTTFFSMTKSSAGAVSDTSVPPFLFANVCTPASVTNWIVNASNGWISSLEPTAGGIGAPIRLQCKDTSFRMVFTGAQANLLLANESGFSNYYTGHLQMGEAPYEAHIWVNTGTGDLYYKWGSAPTSATDGSLFAYSGGSSIRVSDAVGPDFQWWNTGAAADEGRWTLGNTTTALKLRVLTDAGVAGAVNGGNVFQAVRGIGATISRFELAARLAIVQDATFDIGDASFRFRDFYLSRNAKIDGKLTVGAAIVRNPVTIAYSASMTPDASLGNVQVITATNGTAFTINAPTNPANGGYLTIRIRNTSGGALGAVTWNAVFKLAAWTSPATANSRSITFSYDGTNWVEETRTSADVPN